MLSDLADLPADAIVRVHAIDPQPDATVAEHIATACGKLFRQFVAEEAVSQAAVAVEHGRFLVMAWINGPGEGLSGCRKDKIGRLLQKLETEHGLSMLDTPPLVIESEAGIACYDRAALRPLVAAGSVTQDSMMWDLRGETLGQWRDSARMAIRDSWMAPILQRMWQATNA